MLQFSNFKISGILLVIFLGFVFSLPNFVSEDTRSSWPDALPHNALNLGLDLRGGSHLLLAVDTDTVTREKLEALVGDVRNALREASIGYRGLGVSERAVLFTVTDAAQQQAAIDAIRGIDQGTLVGLLNAGPTSNELTVTDDGADGVRVSFTEAAEIARNSKTVQQSIEIIRRRVDELGTTEPVIQRQGETRVLVQVPGLDDPQRLKDLLGQTAKLNFHLVDPNVSAYEVLNGGRQPAGTQIVYTETDPPVPYLIQRRVMVSGERLVDANMGFDPTSGAPEVDFRFDAVGGKRFGDVTKANIGRPFAIVLDGKIVSAPVIQTAILGGSGRITGSFTVQEANDLAILLRAGALPAPMNVLEERTVGPGLGADSVAAGEKALVVGFAAVIIFMLLSYRLFGLFANIALIANLILIMGVLSALQATLTLPGIAGIVLTVGMAVDANVLIFERIREEMRDGRTAIVATDLGYSRALGTIMDANITTLLAAIILFQLGSGPIRGFAVTLGVGIVTSVFTAFVLTRLFVALWLKRQSRDVVLPL
jgi:preprotein translocase subunit SecD